MRRQLAHFELIPWENLKLNLKKVKPPYTKIHNIILCMPKLSCNLYYKWKEDIWKYITSAIQSIRIHCLVGFISYYIESMKFTEGRLFIFAIHKYTYISKAYMVYIWGSSDHYQCFESSIHWTISMFFEGLYSLNRSRAWQYHKTLLIRNN